MYGASAILRHFLVFTEKTNRQESLISSQNHLLRFPLQAMASASSSASAAPPPPPVPPQQKSFLRRIFPFLFAVNLAVGAYVLVRTSQNGKKDGEALVEVPSTPPASHEASAKASSITSTPEPVKELPPIPENEQRELLKWILEEKRKVKPANPAEKKKIDEEKALLKQLIRSNSLPNL